MEKMRKFDSVDEYMLFLPDDKRIVLEKVRKAIKKAAPKAEESISYGMPGYKYKGALVYFAAFKNHCSFFLGKKVGGEYAKELAWYKVSWSTIQFTPEKPLPMLLIEKLVKMRVKENEERFAAKKSQL